MRCELLHDPERGPGHGLLKIAPLTPAPAVVRFSLMRNQGGDRYLGPEGRWQATVYEHDASAEASDGGVSVALGPWFVDAIIEQSPAVLYQLSVAAATGKLAGSLRVDRQRLLGSKAESKTAPKPPVVAAVDRGGEPEAEPESEAPVVEPEPVAVEVAGPEPPPRPRSRLLLGILSVLGLAAVGLWAWWDCRIPWIAPGRCSLGGLTSLPPAPPPEPVPEPAPEPATCAGLDANGCLAVAVKSLKAHRLEPARQLLQQAAKLGATEASLHLAEMYDPKTWASDRSPVEKADWETASYWYEEAARGGEARGMIGAGRLYCQFASDPVFVESGLEWLRKAATAPDADAEVKELLTACEGKSR